MSGRPGEEGRTGPGGLSLYPTRERPSCRPCHWLRKRKWGALCNLPAASEGQSRESEPGSAALKPVSLAPRTLPLSIARGGGPAARGLSRGPFSCLASVPLGPHEAMPPTHGPRGAHGGGSKASSRGGPSARLPGGRPRGETPRNVSLLRPLQQQEPSAGHGPLPEARRCVCEMRGSGRGARPGSGVAEGHAGRSLRISAA